MSLLDPPASKPDKSRAMAFTLAALALVAIVILWFAFRYYPEKKAAERFFNALVAGDSAGAYQLWKPSASYTMKDFLADWGPQGLLRPSEELRDRACKGAERVHEHRCHRKGQSLLPNAGHIRRRKEPQDKSHRSLGPGRRQIFQFSPVAASATNTFA